MAPLLLLALVGVLFLAYSSPAGASIAPAVTGAADELLGAWGRVMGGFRIPARGAQYAAAIAEAEQANGLPAGLLARQLYQESRYLPDIVSGATRSGAGAIGIAQFMPATAAELGVDPFDPYSSIDGAARYMRQLFERFGSWQLALAAYNWGQGNEQRDLRDGIVGNEWPSETRRYVTEILADVPGVA